MAFAYFDRIKETSTSTGTGAITLGGAVSGFQAFSARYSNGDTFYYTITDQIGSNWEVGSGTYSSSGNQLTRTTVLASSNSGAAVNFTSGFLYVFVDLPAAVLPSSSATLVNTLVSTLSSLASIGTVTTGTWNGTTIAVNHGGTGATTLTGVLKGNGTAAFTAATAGTDYVAPGTVTAFSAQQYFAAQALTSGSSIAWNCQTQQAASLTLATNATLANPTNQKNGSTYTLIITQDGTGSRTLAYGTNYKFPGGTAPTLSTAAGAVDILTFISNGTQMYGVAQLAFA